MKKFFKEIWDNFIGLMICLFGIALTLLLVAMITMGIMADLGWRW